jgi:hypothetical protein
MIIQNINRLKAYASNMTIQKALKISVSLIPALLMLADNAFAVNPVNLDAGAEEFISPVIKLIDKWSPAFIFAGGVIGAIAAPGDQRIKFGAALGGMTVAGLGVFAAKKMLGITIAAG